MPRHVSPRFLRLLGMLLLVLFAACGKAPPASEAAIDVHDGDVCAVCGMYLRGSPGPRAQAWVAGQRKPQVFDSIRDFFAWVLQPEHQANVESLYVQNSALIDWQHPTGAAHSFIDARRAYYVAWQPLPGSMGATLAPFATRADAEAFVAKEGGAVLTFAQVTPDLVAGLAGQCPSAATPDVLPPCHTLPVGAAHAEGDDTMSAAMSHSRTPIR